MTNESTKPTGEIDNNSDSCCASSSCCAPQSPVMRQSPKVGRNDPCPCGNGQKFKKCCGKN